MAAPSTPAQGPVGARPPAPAAQCEEQRPWWHQLLVPSGDWTAGYATSIEQLPEAVQKRVLEEQAKREAALQDLEGGAAGASGQEAVPWWYELLVPTGTWTAGYALEIDSLPEDVQRRISQAEELRQRLEREKQARVQAGEEEEDVPWWYRLVVPSGNWTSGYATDIEQLPEEVRADVLAMAASRAPNERPAREVAIRAPVEEHAQAPVQEQIVAV